MKNILLIGAGTMGAEHANAYYSMKEVNLVGIVDLSKKRAEDIIGQHPTQYFSTFEEAVHNLEKIDVVDICVPTYLHKEYVKKAADLGIHMICEKPLAYHLEDAKEMINYCKEKHVELYVAHVVRFFPQYVKAKELVENGSIGEVAVVRTKRGGNFPIGWEDWYNNLSKSGGVLLDLLIHDFDFLRWTFGEVERVFAKGMAINSIDHMDYALVTLTFQSGVIAHVEGTWAHQMFSTQFEFSGKEGIIEYDSLKEEPVLLSLKQSEDKKSGVSVPESPLKQSPYYLELEHFLHCLETGETPIVTAEDAYKAMEISHAALESLKSGLPVTIKHNGGDH